MSINIAFSQIATSDASALFDTDHVINKVCIDTRTLQPGDTYIAIIGEKFDGHDFIMDAIEAGAESLIVSRPVTTDLPVLIVTDTVITLGYIARLYRDQLDASVIGITGSNGKTTVKGMLQSVCEQVGQTTATLANNNNTIGVPLTLLSATVDDEFIVVEMGTSEQGEIPYLVTIVDPDVAVITNISESHLAGIGSRDNVHEEKSGIVTGARENTVIVLNQDDAYTDNTKKLLGDRRLITFGLTADADVYASYLDAAGSVVVKAMTPIGGFEYQLSVPGKHNVANSLAVIALSIAVDIDQPSIIAGLEAYQGSRGRLQTYQLSHDITLIDDTYNANPASSHAALDVLGTYRGRKLFAYAGMAELGEQAEALHQAVGYKADSVGVDQLYIYGHDAIATYDAFSGEKYFFEQLEDLSETLVEKIIPGDAVLVKGSRRYQMDQVSKYIEGSLN